MSKTKDNLSFPLVPNDSERNRNEESDRKPTLWFPDLVRPFCCECEESTPIEKFEGTTLPTPLPFLAWQERYDAYKSIESTVFDSGKMLPGSPLFWNEIKAATNRIYLFDKRIDEGAFRRILEVLKERERINRSTLSVILITNTPDNVFNRLKSVHNSYKFVSTNVYVPRCKNCVLKLMHDRFAVIDDEIWHFGVTIGGMHECINAFSGPWKDIDGKMQQLLDELRKIRWEGNASYLGKICD